MPSTVPTLARTPRAADVQCSQQADSSAAKLEGPNKKAAGQICSLTTNALLLRPNVSRTTFQMNCIGLARVAGVR
jgi:hypothetical protein